MAVASRTDAEQPLTGLPGIRFRAEEGEQTGDRNAALADFRQPYQDPSRTLGAPAAE
jgi:hypothetical protein